MLMFLALFGVLFGSFVLIRAGGPQGLREQYRNQGHITVTPLLMGGSEAIALLFLSIAALVMGKLEHRKFSEYGLPLRKALGKDFWIGSLSGFLAISSTLLGMFLLRGFRVTGLALHGTAILSALIAWGIAFLLAGLVEEFLCRGYLQYTLASGIGFWPAAFVMSGLFAFGHSFNSNETAVGVVATGLFSLLFCLFLRRTGNLWIAVGFHAAWDWEHDNDPNPRQNRHSDSIRLGVLPSNLNSEITRVPRQSSFCTRTKGATVSHQTTSVDRSEEHTSELQSL